MNTRSLSSIVVLLASVHSVAAQEKPLFRLAAPERVELDVKKLKELDAFFNAEVESGRIVGCVGLIARGDEVGYVNTWGQRDREAKQPMTPDTIFRIYSMSKPITSVAAMQLVERGKMSLDDPVQKYLPALTDLKVQAGGEDTRVPAKRAMTVRDLLRHTSGLTYGIFGNTPVDQKYRQAGILVTTPTIEDMVNRLGEIPLLHQPGARWHYSVSTDVLGRLVEVVSGQRFDKYLHENIFKPLDMTDTSFMVPEAKRNRFAQMYAPAGQGKLKPAPAMSSVRFLYPANKFFSGGGGLCSTTRDYLRFSRALLRGGELDGQRILKPETLAEMTKNQLEGSNNFRFGLGFRISPEGDYSWGGAAGTRFWVNPKRNLICIYMVQINPYRVQDYGARLRRAMYDADLRKIDE